MRRRHCMEKETVSGVFFSASHKEERTCRKEWSDRSSGHEKPFSVVVIFLTVQAI